MLPSIRDELKSLDVEIVFLSRLSHVSDWDCMGIMLDSIGPGRSSIVDGRRLAWWRLEVVVDVGFDDAVGESG